MFVPLSLSFTLFLSKPLCIDLSTNIYTLSAQNAISLNLTPFFYNKNNDITTIFVHTDDRHQEMLRIITVYTLYTVVSRLLTQNNMYEKYIKIIKKKYLYGISIMLYYYF